MAHTRRSRKFGHDIRGAVCAVGSRNGGRAMAVQIASHTRPRTPVNTNAARHPYASARGPTINGVTIAPIVPPLNDVAMPRARRLAGRDSTAVLNPPGKVA